MTALQAFHNDPAVKQFYLDRIQAHHDADEIVKGRYWENGKGCAVGCTIHSDSHEDLAEALGIDVRLTYLEDTIFEHLPNAEAMEWPRRFTDAIVPGADTSHVADRFLVWLLVDAAQGVIRFADTDATRAAIQGVAALYQRRIAGDDPALMEWSAAGAAAWAAAGDAAGAAAWDAARAAARAAAWDAARAAARAAAWDAARAAAYHAMAEKLIALLGEASK